MTSAYGRRDAQWALLDAIGHARRFVYIETPGFTPTQRDYAAAGESVPPYAADLIAALAARLNAAPGLHVAICVPRDPDFAPGYEPAAAYEAAACRAAILGLPSASSPDASRVVAFHLLGFPGRRSRLESTVVIVDDVWRVFVRRRVCDEPSGRAYDPRFGPATLPVTRAEGPGISRSSILFEEGEEFRVGVARVAGVGADSAGRHLQGGEQRGRAMTLVVMGLPCGQSRSPRQHRLGAVQGLDLGFVIDADYHRALGRVEIQSTASRILGSNSGSVEDLNVSIRCGRWARSSRSGLPVALAVGQRLVQSLHRACLSVIGGWVGRLDCTVRGDGGGQVSVQFDGRHGGQLAAWASQSSRRRTRRSGTVAEGRHGLRFAFYGRTSTEDYQDAASSRCWQREAAENVIAGRGVIVAEFFDTGYSRRLPWSTRPGAAALLEAVRDPDRGFDAIVVGEFERAFYGSQLQQLLPMFERYGVQVWLPETDGPIDITDAVHQALLLLLGAQSRREVLRSRHRVLAAMRAQVCEQGRYLGGRPPYGYRLVDAGPHPNRAHAQWGRRLRRLDPDPATARHVRWMFVQRIAGRSVAGIARELNDRGVPCPSHVDPGRNSHRSGEAWTLRTVTAILANPRYTGRQVWNRQARDHDALPTGGKRRRPVHHWNPVRDWVISKDIVHPPLVTEQDFVAVQAIRAARPTADGDTRSYLLAGLLQCGDCGRRMDAHWVHGRPGYRCRHGHTSSRSPNTCRAKSLYVREEHILVSLPALLADLNLQLRDTPTPTADQDEIVAFLRANNLMITCNVKGWTLLAVAPDPEHAMMS